MVRLFSTYLMVDERRVLRKNVKIMGVPAFSLLYTLGCHDKFFERNCSLVVDVVRSRANFQQYIQAAAMLQ
jgi:hypothetical protein